MKHLGSYEREVDKGKLTAVATFERLRFERESFKRFCQAIQCNFCRAEVATSKSRV